MKEVFPNLYVGDEEDYNKNKGRLGWAYVHAAKDPYHRQALGYKTLGAPKNHPEYLIAYRGERLILNLVDLPVDKAEFIPDSIIEEAIEFIRIRLGQGQKVLVNCNQGQSRAPSIALAYMVRYGELGSFNETEEQLKKVYPKYDPAGIRTKLKDFFKET